MIDKQPKAIPLLAAAMIASALASPSQAADDQRSPSAVIAGLAERIYVLGETTGNVADMIAAEATAAEEVRRYVRSGKTEGLLATGNEKTSPLGNAAYLGYPNVAAALLESPVVKSHMNDAGELGMTPWMASNFSMKQSAWICNPGVFENPYSFIPMFVTAGYYLSNPTPPYKATRDVLERAGVSPQPDKAKEVWATVCKNQPAEGKSKVQASSDIQATIQELGAAALVAHLQEMHKRMQGAAKD